MGDNETMAKCYGKSLKGLGQEDTTIGYIFLDHSDLCEENRLDMGKNQSRKHSLGLFSGSEKRC